MQKEAKYRWIVEAADGNRYTTTREHAPKLQLGENLIGVVQAVKF